MKNLLLTLSLVWVNISSAQTYFPPLIGTAWETISPDSLGWCSDEIQVLYDYLEQTDSKAFIVLKNGKIVLEKYFGTFTADSMHTWNSAGKTLTAYAVGIAAEDGDINLDASSSVYLGNGYSTLSMVQENAISIRNHLSMTSGFDDGVADPFCTDPGCLIYLSAPGTRWAYHNAPYTILDDVIVNATGAVSLNAYVNQKISSKIGMNGFYFQVGYNNLFISKPRSLARFGLLLSQNGTWNSTPVLSNTAYLDLMKNSSQSLNNSYGYLTWLNGKSSYMIPQSQAVFPGKLVPSAPDDMFCALGKNAQVLAVVPSENLVVVRMGGASGTALVEVPYVDSIFSKLNAVICTSNLTEGNQNKKLSFYPNPAENSMLFSENLDSYEIRCLNNLGQEMQVKKMGQEINVQELSTGAYTIILSKNQQLQYHKFIIK